VRTIPDKVLLLPNGAHGAPCLAEGEGTLFFAAVFHFHVGALSGCK
jgi:hypothetical protein